MEQIVIIEPNEEELGKSISQIVRLKPNHCKFPVTGLPWHVTQYPEAVISEQSRGLMGANMQLFEFYAKKNISLSFRITKPTSFLFFHLGGEIEYYSEQGIRLTIMRKPTFYLTYGPATRYQMKLKHGHHAILGIALEQIWSFTTDELTSVFDEFYTAWLGRSNMPVILPHKKITKEVWRILAKLRLTAVRNIEDNIGMLKQISLCLEAYYRYVIEDNKNHLKPEQIIGERIRIYLDDHYMFDEDCRLDIIRERFNLTEWELRKIAKNTFGCSIGQYVNILRLENSIKLLLETDLTVNEITVRIGFTSPTTFSNYFRNKTGYSPSNFRKNK